MSHKLLPPIPTQSRHYLASESREASNDDAPPSYRASVQKPAPLDLPQRIERKLAQYNASQSLFRRWLFEIISWTTSAVCMGAIVGILIYSRDRLLSERSFALATYNVLSKVASAALILPISEAIGQLKWAWFQGDKSKEMIDFEIFDKASRGAWGSFLLLFRTKGRSLAALGAVLTLLLLATDTFFQQVTDYPDQWALEHLGGAIPRVVRYNPFYTPEYFEGLETTFINPAMRPVVGQFMINNGTPPMLFGNGTRPEIPLTCPSSNCTWPEYRTLGVCSKCVEVSDILRYACLMTSVDWSTNHIGPLDSSRYPNKTACGYFLNATSASPVLMSGRIIEDDRNESTVGESLLVRSIPLTDMINKTPLFGGSINFKHLRNPILDALIVSAANGADSILRNDTPVAHECVLAWCVQTLRSSYALGGYKEEILTKLFNTTSGPWPWDAYRVNITEDYGTMNIYKEDINIITPEPTPDAIEPALLQATYGMSNTTTSYIAQAFDDYFPSSYTALSSSDRPMLRYKNFLAGPNLRKLQFNPFQAPNNITRHMERLAIAMTNVMRSDVDSNDIITGQAYNKKQFVVVRWEWLTFPLALLVLSLAFLVATIVKTSRGDHEELGIWKTSAMPALIYSLPENVQRELEGRTSEGFGDSEKAKKVKIQLLPRHGWRVSGHTLTTPSFRRGLNHQPPPGWI
ncbi:hypothetical protein C7974DRAFT_163116 [Boeremia exigua]|uniref:uncharacterized protein n=1 Tax=Boeremia exigua TaxID=749465 RepID=UPI001E8DDB0F|nr:uncharacterized protein C7974DRAFT_163116 [Boeremia exigua]KAH6632988.1 hypothetical protein C7974DRAFT_163116 [Boeremia exigua]